jgi:hypothetical protein
VCHLLARNGPGYFFKDDEKYDVIVHSQKVITGTMKSNTREGATLWKMVLEEPGMGVSTWAVSFTSMVNRGMQSEQPVLEKRSDIPLCLVAGKAV